MFLDKSKGGKEGACEPLVFWLLALPPPLKSQRRRDRCSGGGSASDEESGARSRGPPVSHLWRTWSITGICPTNKRLQITFKSIITDSVSTQTSNSDWTFHSLIFCFNLFRSNDVPRNVENVSRPQNCNIFSTQAKRIINLLLLNHFYPVISERKRRIIVYGLVTRYGPQSVASATG